MAERRRRNRPDRRVLHVRDAAAARRADAAPAPVPVEPLPEIRERARACHSHRRERPSRSRSRRRSSSRAPRAAARARRRSRRRSSTSTRRDSAPRRDRHGARAEKEYLTFSIDDVAPPRPAEEPEPERSIFDPGPRSRGPTVGQPGQQRTAFGRRMSELCNALTGGFSLMGFGSFCAAANEEPSGLFPEVRPGVPGSHAGVRRDARHGAAAGARKPRSRPSSAVSSSRRTPRTNPKISRCL